MLSNEVNALSASLMYSDDQKTALESERDQLKRHLEELRGECHIYKTQSDEMKEKLQRAEPIVNGAAELKHERDSALAQSAQLRQKWFEIIVKTVLLR